MSELYIIALLYYLIFHKISLLKTRLYKSSPFIKWAFPILYLFFLALSGIYSFKKPSYNWDMLPYMALAAGIESHSAVEVHNIAYNDARQQISAKAYNMLVDTTHSFRREMFANPGAFNNQLAFYAVKPLYIYLIYAIYKMGAPLTVATFLPSIIAYFLIGILLFIWLSKYVPIPLTFAISACTMLTAPLLNTAKLSTPDCLSGFFIFLAIYFILERKSLLPAFIFLLLSLFTRIDNVIACLVILSMVMFTNEWDIKISNRKYALVLGIIIISYLLISYNSSKYGWNILFYPSFAQHLNTHSGMGNSSPKEYFLLAYSQIKTGLAFSHLVTYVSMLLLVFICQPQPSQKLNANQLMVATILLILAIRFVLLPEIDDRFNITWYVISVALLVSSINSGHKIKITKENIQL